jgi:rubrerythrin
VSIDFNADEVFEMAEEIERNGAKFYRRAAEHTSDEDGKKLLTDLAAWEDQHEKLFVSMRADLSGPEMAVTVFDPDDQTAQYLQAMADGHVFDLSDPSIKLTGDETLGEILRTAIGREEDAIVFFLGMKDMVSGGLGKDKIDGIIKEEMGHVVMLSKQLIATG